MADDHRLDSYRSNDPQRRAAEPSRSAEQPRANDPLAELARLIGQRDPFAEFGRRNSRQNSREANRQAQAAPAAPAPQWQPQEQEFTADHGRGSDAYGSHAGYAQPAYDVHEQNPDRRVYDEAPLAADQQALHHSQYAEQHGQYAEEHGQHGQYAQQGGQYGNEDRLHENQQYAEDAHGGYDAEQQYYQDDVPFEPHEDELYDDPPPTRRRGTLVTALALVGCALLGTVGAYAYRSYSGPSSTEPPPVITADTSTPTKIVPATAGDAGKADPDRVANADKEQLVSKQEEPVALKEVAPSAAPRMVAPPPAGASAQGAHAGQPSSGGSPPPSTEPKKIRTVTIRPDGSDMSGKPVGMPAPGAPAAAQRQAPTPPAPAAGGRTQTAAAPATDSTSPGFVVQLSSQKSESEAMSSFRSLQAKFPNELGGRQPTIRRADLGSKGIFYRTLVGPFASAHEASQFCASYRAAGGQCVVPNN